jgi:hypothetical protein
VRLTTNPPRPAQIQGAGRRRLGARRTDSTATVVGAAAVLASLLYFASDAIEAIQGGFSTGQLWLTFVAEAAVPIFVIGLAIESRPRLGRVGEIAAVAYAYSFIFFTGTVVDALVNDIEDYEALTHRLGTAMTVHGGLMVIAGLAFGYAVIRAQAFPVWTATALMVGVALVALTQGAPGDLQLVAAGVRDLAFLGMGTALLRGDQPVSRRLGGGTPLGTRA